MIALARLLAAAFAVFATVAAADVRIAVVGPMTGESSAFGKQMRRGAEMAVADINARGGVLGQQIILEVGDDACDPRLAVAVAKQMAGKGVVFVDGHYCSSTSIPASDVYAERNVLQISPGSTNPQLTERGLKNVFRVCGRDDQQGAVAGKYIAQHFRGRRVAILHDQSVYGRGLAEETKKTLNRLGVREALFASYTPGGRNYSALIDKLKGARINVMYIGGYYAEVGLILRQARAQGLGATLMSGDSIAADAFWAVTGAAGEGALMTFSPDPARNPAAKPVVDRFLKEGRPPEGYTLYSYAAVQAWAQAAARAKSAKADAVAKVLKSGEKFGTVLGPISFDAKGDVIGTGYVVYVWRKGKYGYAKE
jgi:branched-chain amino acid transport system substrate-binding protein